ncbi:SH3 domain-containing protein [Roseibium sp. Sym1]|uniref:SH3 domain-containing protein n=1 Tax=Roseibium sp. Sym1 TaxID=3016006 RepID=UPI0022B58B66|nr:SH3 domain-containing protein [Roseibium sp. Sym1]
MYFVSAPAAACEDFAGIHSDNAPKKIKKTDLKLVPNIQGSQAAKVDGPVATSDTLAAKILEMHAASSSPEQAACRPPKLKGVSDDPAFEMPGVLKRPEKKITASSLRPDPVPQPVTGRPVFGGLRKHPGFKILLVGTLLVLSAGGLAAFYSPGAPIGDGERTVPTERIAAEPTIESLIAGSTPSGQKAAGTLDSGTPTAEQIARAKDRIRNAFQESGRSADLNTDPTLPLSTPPARDQDGKVQARLTTPAADPSRTASPHTPRGSQRVTSDRAALAIAASAAAASNRPGSAAVATTTLQTAEEQPVPPLHNASEAAGLPGTPASSEAYPNTGRTTAAVNFRRTEDKNAEVLGTIPAGTEVSFDSCGTWWCGVVHEGRKGFVGQKYLERSR